MARIRSIKPEFFTNEDLAELQPLARLLFIGLWTAADREGRLEDRPRRLKVALLPYDKADIDALLSDLASRGFIIRYAIDGLQFIQIPTFTKHQHCHIKEVASTLPAPPENSASTVLAPVSHPTSTPGGGREQEGSRKEKEPSALAESHGDGSPQNNQAQPEIPGVKQPPVMEFPVTGEKLPARWTLTAAKLAEYKETFETLDVLAEMRDALQWLRDNPRELKTARGMPRFLGHWLRTAVDKRRHGSNGNGGGKPTPARQLFGDQYGERKAAIMEHVRRGGNRAALETTNEKKS